ncbi:TonB-dependent receptor [Siphonobacter aquaeclarae]|uniref:Iron complex outermembrane recepter protein n=1 Tax=Siphonobacter aquaeclarae TaxID=563176 RepID=A0A1G9HFW5_9BACT|nr:TonB-dependent receptor [Siphonobacter aquaeclarae]SDL11931.1 iron complex outermembrane recepter protein [Siphonobacter aquaeclarae]
MIPSALVWLHLSASAIRPDTLPRRDTIRVNELAEIVISASRVPESVLKSPVSIDVLDARRIRLSAQPSYFDAIENIKGVQLLTSSLGFKVYNTRGFAATTNVRFVQLVDGRDNQAPHIGAPIAAALAPSDLDIQQVEVLPGVASALYGMNALNGMVNILTRNPFDYQGLSVGQKTGVNHVGSSAASAQAYSETSLRYAQQWNRRFAFKVNLVYQRGYDWVADNRSDLNPNGNASLQLFGRDNPAYDPVSGYGNEAANRRTLTLGGKRYSVGRTGYYEDEVTDYHLQNLRGDIALHYRISPTVELVYAYQAATLNNVYQRTNRFRLENYRLDQHSLTLTTPSVQIRAYRSRENTGDSYNIRSMAENIDKSFKTDNQWFADFTSQFNTDTKNGLAVPDALRNARSVADQGRPVPGTAAFNNLIGKLRDINNWDIGAALRVKSWMYHVEGQVEPTRVLWRQFRDRTGVSIQAGFDFRRYVVYPDGNYFINPTEPDKNLVYGKTGGFVSLSRTFFAQKLKVAGSFRVDKNSYFDARFNPRVSAVYSPSEGHSIRLSYQNGYRFPSLFEGFTNINSGGVKRVGGLPVMSRGIYEKAYLVTSINAFQSAITADVNTNGLTTEQAIQKNKALLNPSPYTYLKPEQVNSVETGYRGMLLRGRLYLDVDAYYTAYRNFIAQVNANLPRGTNPDSLAYYFSSSATQERYRLWTNSQTRVFNYGVSAGIRYSLGGDWSVAGNASFAQLDRVDKGDGLESAFNTPKWITNLSITNGNLWKGLGFSVNYKHQDAFLWQSELATGTVAAINTLDAQVSYRIQAWNMLLKAGGTNVTNRPYYTFIGGPAVGGFYYTNVVWEWGRTVGKK